MCWSACTKHLWSTLNELDVSLDITLTWLMDSKISIYLLLLWSWNDFAKQACFVAFTLLYMTEQSVRLVHFFGLLKAVSQHSLVQTKVETLLQLLERSSQSPWPFPVITWAAYAKRECILPLGPNSPVCWSAAWLVSSSSVSFMLQYGIDQSSPSGPTNLTPIDFACAVNFSSDLFVGFGFFPHHLSLCEPIFVYTALRLIFVLCSCINYKLVLSTLTSKIAYWIFSSLCNIFMYWMVYPSPACIIDRHHFQNWNETLLLFMQLQ